MVTPLQTFDAEGLRVLAKCARDPAQTRRLLALSVIYAGGSRLAAAALGGVELQTVRDWVLAFNAPGTRPRLNGEQREALRTPVEQGPMPAAHRMVRSRLVDLAHLLFEDHGVSVSEQTLSRVLWGMSYRKLSARPRNHAQAPDAIPASKKPSPPARQRSRRPQAESR
ncbi:conserved hypothetical protein (plasmid) [Methylobacterium radiotolerans JCM 2831]|uniref:Winged helix-turn helix domain-containing protein n=1 Tax=Methylobacterium radiotolerans (strain ATCC 27329 / DSM 1819 / JCM 2831 / NBRC 15690 / NCIMB 10815 / 0-1) TaxID=426355 RepID=B1M984_METRJ|nr:conserved hypothetical protein [Methylobacterium radiotolerans JCM 2831]GEN01789.1 hypothetical protein MRA01_63280 [Methylobacterium radiotolerans]